MRRMTLAGIGLAAVLAAVPAIALAQEPGPRYHARGVPLPRRSRRFASADARRRRSDDAGSRHAGHVGYAPADGLDDGPDELDDEPTGVTSACEAKSDRCGVPMGPVASRSIHE